ncbi:MAG: glucuronate isomerase [Gemmataceae bacterium]
MIADTLSRDLFDAICQIPLLDPHSHVEPHRATAKSLDDLLGYHYYTELAHSSGMSQEPLRPDVDPRERCRAILAHMDRFDNTAQYSWFLEIVRDFLGLELDRVTAADCDTLVDTAATVFGQPDWEAQVFWKTNLERIFLTNNFDDPLDGFDTAKYVPCLRTDDLVFHLGNAEVHTRLAKATGIEVGDVASCRQAIGKLFEHFTSRGAKACAISLPPTFEPSLRYYDVKKDDDADVIHSFEALRTKSGSSGGLSDARSVKVFWMLAEFCRDFKLPFDLMIGVNRRVYRNGVYQGQDLFDQRTSLLQYADLFNAFPSVTFPVSVLSSAQNQELVSHAWIFPNVVTSGHWWYSNIPAYIASDLRARLNAVPKTKQLGYYSDAYKLEFVRPKYNMYRRVLAATLADEYVRPGRLSETQAIELAKTLLRDNVSRIFNV